MQRLIGKEENRGFTLIELALVVTVLGLVVAPLFAFIGTQLKKEQQVEAQNKEKTILAALSLYVKQNERYPCPARPDLAPGDVNFGRESVVNAANGGCSSPGAITATAGNFGGAAPAPFTIADPILGPRVFVPDTRVYIGAVPTHALNLPQTYGANSENTKYFYAVTGAQAHVDSFGRVGNGVRIVDAAGNEAIQGGGRAAFVLVDPGKNMLGARKFDTRVMTFNCPIVAVTNDNENCNGDSTFRDAALVLQQGATYFDDTVYYSLIREDSTFFRVSPSSTNPGAVDVVTRNQGNVGVGTNSPEDKLHVSGGGVLVEDGDIVSTGQVRSPNFRYAP